MKKKVIFVLVCILFISFALPTTGTISKKEISSVKSELDQYQEQIDDCLFFESGAWQKFEPTKSTLTEVELHIGNYFSGSYPLIMTIEAPFGCPIAQKILTASEIPLDYCDWTVFDIDDITITNGASYFIVLTYHPGCEYCWSGAWGDQYPHGDSSEGSDWDWCFRTYAEGDGDSQLELDVKGGLLGYDLTVTNLGTEPISGDLTIEITTNASIILVGGELAIPLDDLTLSPGESHKFKMKPVIGFGPATITLSGTFETTDVYPFEVTTNGFVFLILVYGKKQLQIP